LIAGTKELKQIIGIFTNDKEKLTEKINKLTQRLTSLENKHIDYN